MKSRFKKFLQLSIAAGLVVVFIFSPYGTQASNADTAPLPTTSEEQQVIVKFKNQGDHAYTYEAIAYSKLQRLYPGAPPSPEAIANNQRIAREKLNEAMVPDTLQSYRDAKEIVFVQVNRLRHATEEAVSAESSWGVERNGMGTFAKQLHLSKDSRVVVAVVDTGVDYNHPFLKDRIVPGYDFVDKDSDPMESATSYHGTHVAGIIVQSTPANVKVMPVRVLGKTADGSGTDYDIAKGILYAADHGANIINLSLGGAGYSPYMDDAINYAIGKGALVVAAAGNDSNDTKDYFPASKEEIVVVSALTEADDLASFSNYGHSVDLTAPGENIASSLPHNTFGKLSGTSMAAPFVCAAAALLELNDPGSSPQEIESLLKRTTDDLGLPGRDDAFGEGVVNLAHFTNVKEEFKLISPNADSKQNEALTVKTIINQHANDKLVITLNNKAVVSRIVKADGYQSDSVSLAGLAAGTYQLKVQVGTGARSKSETIPVQVILYNTSFAALDIHGNPMKYFNVQLFGVKGKASRNFEWVYAKGDGLARTNLDLDSLLEQYDYILAVAVNADDKDFPVYVREVVSTGAKLFAPMKLQKVTFAYPESSEKLNKTLGGTYAASIVPSVHGVYIQGPYVKSFDLKEDAVLYVDEGKHIVQIGGYNFYSADKLNGTGQTQLNMENDSSVVNVIGETGIQGGANGLGSDNHATMNIYLKGNEFVLTSGTMLNPGENRSLMKHGIYRFMLWRTVKSGTEMKNVMLYRDQNLSERTPTVDIRYGGTLSARTVFDYSVRAAGVIRVTDPYDNLLVMNEREFMDPANASYAMESDSPLNVLPAESLPQPTLREFQTTVVLTNEKTGNRFTTEVNGNNAFQFSQTLPDGSYALTLKNVNDVYPLKPYVEHVNVKAGKFVSNDAKPNHKPVLVKPVVDQSVLLYKRLQLRLADYFNDADGDSLQFKVSEGYIQDGVYYFDGNATGLYPIAITASDLRTGSVTAKFQIAVTDGVIQFAKAIKELVLNSKYLVLTSGRNPAQLTARKLPSDAVAQKLVWKSSNDAIAAVNQSGLVTPKSPGTATITVYTAGGKVKSVCTVKVIAPK